MFPEKSVKLNAEGLDAVRNTDGWESRRLALTVDDDGQCLEILSTLGGLEDLQLFQCRGKDVGRLRSPSLRKLWVDGETHRIGCDTPALQQLVASWVPDCEWPRSHVGLMKIGLLGMESLQGSPWEIPQAQGTLQSLHLIDPRLTTLDGMPPMPVLNELRVDRVTSTLDLGGIVAAPCLRRLLLMNIKRLVGLEAVSQLRELEGLTFTNCGDISALGSLREMRNLRHLSVERSACGRDLAGEVHEEARVYVNGREVSKKQGLKPEAKRSKSARQAGGGESTEPSKSNRHKRGADKAARIEEARKSLRDLLGTEAGTWNVNLYVRHHLKELPPEYWIQHCGTSTPTELQVLDLLEVYPDDEAEKVGGAGALDFILPGGVTTYVLLVRFDRRGEVKGVEMES